MQAQLLEREGHVGGQLVGVGALQGGWRVGGWGGVGMGVRCEVGWGGWQAAGVTRWQSVVGVGALLGGLEGVCGVRWQGAVQGWVIDSQRQRKEALDAQPVTLSPNSYIQAQAARTLHLNRLMCTARASEKNNRSKFTLPLILTAETTLVGSAHLVLEALDAQHQGVGEAVDAQPPTLSPNPKK